MDQHAQALAGSHVVSSARSAEQLLSRLTENEDVLIAAHSLLAEAIKDSRRITPAGEWLLDNFYLIEEQIRTVRRFLASYQTVTTLKLGELGAIPIMARLALIENLRRVSARISAARTDRN